MPQRTCEHCGKTFNINPAIIRRGGGRFCSNPCKFAASQNRVEVACAVCGKQFTAKPSEIKNGFGKYCSKECCFIGIRKGAEYTCEICGKPFYRQDRVIETGRCSTKYCSQKCYAISLRKAVTLTCRQCSKTFTVKPKESHRQFCGWECHHQHRRDRLPSEEIKHLYTDQGLTIFQIGKMFGVTGSTIQYNLERQGIPRRNHAERIIGQPRFGNRLERAVQAVLEELGYRYNTSKRIENRAYDFYLPDFNVLIECDGTFWHADPRFFPKHEGGELHRIQKQQIIHDQTKNEIALRNGYRLLRFWEYDVFNQRDLVVGQLAALSVLPKQSTLF